MSGRGDNEQQGLLRGASPQRQRESREAKRGPQGDKEKLHSPLDAAQLWEQAERDAKNGTKSELRSRTEHKGCSWFIAAAWKIFLKWKIIFSILAFLLLLLLLFFGLRACGVWDDCFFGDETNPSVTVTENNTTVTAVTSKQQASRVVLNTYYINMREGESFISEALVVQPGMQIQWLSGNTAIVSVVSEGDHTRRIKAHGTGLTAIQVIDTDSSEVVGILTVHVLPREKNELEVVT